MRGAYHALAFNALRTTSSAAASAAAALLTWDRVYESFWEHGVAVEILRGLEGRARPLALADARIEFGDVLASEEFDAAGGNSSDPKSTGKQGKKGAAKSNANNTQQQPPGLEALFHITALMGHLAANDGSSASRWQFRDSTNRLAVLWALVDDAMAALPAIDRLRDDRKQAAWWQGGREHIVRHAVKGLLLLLASDSQSRLPSYRFLKVLTVLLLMGTTVPSSLLPTSAAITNGLTNSRFPLLTAFGNIERIALLVRPRRKDNPVLRDFTQNARKANELLLHAMARHVLDLLAETGLELTRFDTAVGALVAEHSSKTTSPKDVELISEVRKGVFFCFAFFFFFCFFFL